MRHLFLLALLPFPALAEPVDTTSRVTAVTLFPAGAQVTRELAAALPPGRHELRVTDLPEAVLDDPGGLRLLAAPGVRVESLGLGTDPGLTLPPTLAQGAARAEVARRLEAVQAAAAEVARLQAGIAASAARQAFLERLGTETQGATAAQLAEIAGLVGDGVAEAATARIAAEVALIGAEAALAEAEGALSTAQTNPAAGPAQIGGVTLALTVTVTADAPPLRLTYAAGDAGWQPVYDLRLMQGEAPSLTIDRGVSVRQATGEDWTDVALTLSTADLYAQSVPGTLYPDLRRLRTVDDMNSDRAAGRALSGLAMEGEPLVMASPAPMVEMLGDTVTYVFDGTADLPHGAASLRLSLGEVTLPVQVQARAVPRLDETAFLMAAVTNASPEVLLPGQATLIRDGALIGATALPRLAPGDVTDIAFGAIEGLRLTRDMPVRSTGDGGFLSGSTAMEEVAVLEVENLTDRAFYVRLIDQVPYSEQSELAVEHRADPPVTETDVDGQRGVLAWDFTLAPGAVRQVTLTTVLSWPEGRVLE